MSIYAGLTGDPRADRALVALARLLAEIAASDHDDADVSLHVDARTDGRNDEHSAPVARMSNALDLPLVRRPKRRMPTSSRRHTRTH
jgi:hypothetical protein